MEPPTDDANLPYRTKLRLTGVLGVLGMAVGIFGFWQVYRGIRLAGGWLPRIVWFLGMWGFGVGTVFHASFAFVIAGIQADAGTGSLAPMLDRFAAVFEPEGVRIAQIVTAYTLSVLVLFVVSTALLWNVEVGSSPSVDQPVALGVA